MSVIGAYSKMLPKNIIDPSSKPTFDQLPFKEFIPVGDLEKVEDQLRKIDLIEWGEEDKINPNLMDPVQFWVAIRGYERGGDKIVKT